MEALELAHAEQPTLKIKYGTEREIAASGDLVDLSTLPRMRASLFGTNAQLSWVRAAVGRPVVLFGFRTRS
jgi:hypothetical protein